MEHGKDEDRAADLLVRALAAEPGHRDANERLVDVYTRREQWADVEALLDREVESADAGRPTPIASPRCRRSWPATALALGKPDKALDCLESAHRLRPELLPMLRTFADFRYDRGEWQGGRRALRIAAGACTARRCRSPSCRTSSCASGAARASSVTRRGRSSPPARRRRSRHVRGPRARRSRRCWRRSKIGPAGSSSARRWPASWRSRNGAPSGRRSPTPARRTSATGRARRPPIARPSRRSPSGARRSRSCWRSTRKRAGSIRRSRCWRRWPSSKRRRPRGRRCGARRPGSCSTR